MNNLAAELSYVLDLGRSRAAGPQRLEGTHDHLLIHVRLRYSLRSLHSLV